MGYSTVGTKVSSTVGTKTLSTIKTLLFFLLFVGGLSAQAMGNPTERILGKWFFYKKIYQNIEMPEPPEATLRLFFEFFPDGTDHLYWTHVGENDICERKGKYRLTNNSTGFTLSDEILWVNPKNSGECSRDPDMQVGRKTNTPASFMGNDFALHLDLGGDPLIYVWKKVLP